MELCLGTESKQHEPPQISVEVRSPKYNEILQSISMFHVPSVKEICPEPFDTSRQKNDLKVSGQRLGSLNKNATVLK